MPRAANDPDEAALCAMSLALYRASDQVFNDPKAPHFAKRLAWGRLQRGVNRMHHMLRGVTLTSDDRNYLIELLGRLEAS